MIDAIPDEQIISLVNGKAPTPCPGPENPQERKEWLRTARDLTVKFTMDRMKAEHKGASNERGEGIFIKEKRWYNKTRVFLPPAVLRQRHNGFDEAWTTIQQSPTKEPRNVYREVIYSCAGLQALIHRMNRSMLTFKSSGSQIPHFLCVFFTALETSNELTAQRNRTRCLNEKLVIQT